MTYPDYDDDGNPIALEAQTGGQPKESKDIRLLRQKADKHDEVVSERDLLKRENAFLKAGIPDTPQGRLLQRGYDGELTSEAIKSAAIEYGIIEAPAEDAEIDTDLETLGRVDKAMQGAPPSTGHNVLTPAEYASWSPDRRRELIRSNPTAYEALKRGEEVRVAS